MSSLIYLNLLEKLKSYLCYTFITYRFLHQQHAFRGRLLENRNVSIQCSSFHFLGGFLK